MDRIILLRLNCWWVVPERITTASVLAEKECTMPGSA